MSLDKSDLSPRGDKTVLMNCLKECAFNYQKERFEFKENFDNDNELEKFGFVFASSHSMKTKRQFSKLPSTLGKLWVI